MGSFLIIFPAWEAGRQRQVISSDVADRLTSPYVVVFHRLGAG